MHVTIKCAASIFSRYSTALVTTDGSIILTRSDVTVSRCGNTTQNLLSDVILYTRDTTIPIWAWSVSYLVVINGRVYPISMVGGQPYIKGLHYEPAYIPHMDISLIYIPFGNTKMYLRDIYAQVPSIPVDVPIAPTLTIPTSTPADECLIFLGGLLINPSTVTSDGTNLQVELSTELMETLQQPNVATPSLTVTSLDSLLAHPGTFIVKLPPVEVTYIPLGKVNHLITGTPPSSQLLAVDQLGHVLSYKPQSSGLVRFRFCHILPTHWVKITRS